MQPNGAPLDSHPECLCALTSLPQYQAPFAIIGEIFNAKSTKTTTYVAWTQRRQYGHDMPTREKLKNQFM